MKVTVALLVCALVPMVSTAGLKFDESVKDLHAKPEDRILTTDYNFKNTGTEAVTIKKYDAACSCMSLQVKGGKLHYKPGETGVIRATFDMGNFSGEVAKSLHLWIGDDPEAKPSVTLTANVHIPIIVDVEPKTIRWELNEIAKPKKLTITMDYEKPILIQSAECANDSFTTKLTTLEKGKRYELEVTPKSTEGAALGIIQIKTDCPISRHATQRAFAMVRQPVKEALPDLKEK